MKRFFLVLLLSLIAVSPLSAQTPFYQGKTVQIRVGFAAGGAFDLWARVIASHLGRFVPGNPTFVVQNMTGGGSMIAANYVYGVAKPDGLTLGVVSPAMYIEQVTGKKEVQFCRMGGGALRRYPSVSRLAGSHSKNNKKLSLTLIRSIVSLQRTREP